MSRRRLTDGKGRRKGASAAGGGGYAAEGAGRCGGAAEWKKRCEGAAGDRWAVRIGHNSPACTAALAPQRV